MQLDKREPRWNASEKKCEVYRPQHLPVVSSLSKHQAIDGDEKWEGEPLLHSELSCPGASASFFYDYVPSL